MKTSVIRQRVADFLKQYPPLEALAESHLLELAASGRVRFHQSGEYVFRQGQPKGQFVWMIQQGRVELLEARGAGEFLRDVLGDGDMLGLERFVGDGAYQSSARTASDVIVYGLSAEMFESLVPQYPAMQRFLAARVSVSGVAEFGRASWLDAEPPSLDFLAPRLISIPPDSSRRDALHQLRRADIGVALVPGAGVISAFELCSAEDDALDKVAKPCPHIDTTSLTTRQAVREMLAAESETLLLGAASQVDAVLTASDLSLFCGQNVARLAGAIRSATGPAELGPLRRQAARIIRDALGQPNDVDDASWISSRLMAAFAASCLRLAGAERFDGCCWVILGESARGDRLLSVQPTFAAICNEASDPAQLRDVTSTASKLLLECGFEPANFFWPETVEPAMSFARWGELFAETIQNPIGCDLYARREFFDILPLTGDLSLAELLRSQIVVELQANGILTGLLANDTLVSLPPMTFFHGLVLELDGAKRDSFDIDAVALLPLAAAARVFAIAKRRVSPAGTLDRLTTAASDFPRFAPILREAAAAFRIACYFRSLRGARIHPAQLGKFEQVLFKTAFSSIQRLLELTGSAFLSAA